MHPLRAPRRLADLINFRLQRCHSLSGAPVIRLLEGRYGITRREWRLLATLADHGPLSPSELAELSQLSDRELADLGLSRHSIETVAHEAAYGM